MTRRITTVLLGLVLAAGACSSGDDASDDADWPAGTQDARVSVEPDPDAPVFVLNVALTPDGYEPSTAFVPAGHTVRLALRNRTEHEGHYRVAEMVLGEVLTELPPIFRGDGAEP